MMPRSYRLAYHRRARLASGGHTADTRARGSGNPTRKVGFPLTEVPEVRAPAHSTLGSVGLRCGTLVTCLDLLFWMSGG